jgi:hypothetical protein
LFISLITFGLGTPTTRNDNDNQCCHCAFSSSPCLNTDNSDDADENSRAHDFITRDTSDNGPETPVPMKEGDEEYDRFNDIDRCSSQVGLGQKRSRYNSNVDHLGSGGFRKAIKVKSSRGKPKADDWEPDVQGVLAEAILSYETRLVTLGFFPDHMQEVTWAKAAWLDGCEECDVKIYHNTELIKLVWICVVTLFESRTNSSVNSLPVEEHIFVASSRPKLMHWLRQHSVSRSPVMMLLKRTARKLRGSRTASALYIT